MSIRRTLSVLRKIVRPVYRNENTVNLQVGPTEQGDRATMIELVIESPKVVEIGHEEIAIVDNEDHIVKYDVALMEDVETQTSRRDINMPEVPVVRRGSSTLMDSIHDINTSLHSRCFGRLDSILTIYLSCPL